MTKLMTLADATDARHLADARAIVRERKALAVEAAQAAKFQVKRCERLLADVIDLNLSQSTVELYQADLDDAKAKLEAARLALQAM